MQVGVLETMEAVFRMFRTTTIEAVNETLDYCQRTAARPVLQAAQVRLCCSRTRPQALCTWSSAMLVEGWMHERARKRRHSSKLQRAGAFGVTTLRS